VPGIGARPILGHHKHIPPILNTIAFQRRESVSTSAIFLCLFEKLKKRISHENDNRLVRVEGRRKSEFIISIRQSRFDRRGIKMRKRKSRVEEGFPSSTSTSF
jgi:hypothetical protein